MSPVLIPLFLIAIIPIPFVSRVYEEDEDDAFNAPHPDLKQGTASGRP